MKTAIFLFSGFKRFLIQRAFNSLTDNTMNAVSYSLVEEKVECTGAEVAKPVQLDEANCADSCKDISTLFVFGTNDFGTNRCEPNKGCYCLCETAAGPDGTCTTIQHNGYRLYKIEMNTANGGMKNRNQFLFELRNE